VDLSQEASQEVSQELLDKYNTHGPRYTSYPTARQFTSQFGADDYRWHIEDSNEEPIPKSLSLYVHIPFCQSLCYYCGCHKIVTHNKNKAQDYLETLQQEIKLQGALFDKDRKVKQLHFGGGTPTYYNTSDIQQLLKTIAEHFTLAPLSQREYSIEIDPRTASINSITDLATIGFNRMSFGIQDFDNDVQVAINRIQDQQHTLNLLDAARAAGIKSVSIDLIYGLPKQTPKNFTKTLDTIITARPDRISLYHYAHMPHLIKAQKLIREGDIPKLIVKMALLTLSINQLLSAGYQYIGMDHFALPNDPLSKSRKQGMLQRNFQGYSTHSDCDTIGMGVSAISQIGNSFSQNYKHLTQYQHHIQAQKLAIEKGYTLSTDDKIRSNIIQSIMCRQQVDMNKVSKVFGISFKNYFKDELKALTTMMEDGLLNTAQDEINITEKGRFFMRNIAMVFDAYLSPSAQDDTTVIEFSKVL
jgi:oxygen-independent coproporphyrinogen-3 oxidase